MTIEHDIQQQTKSIEHKRSRYSKSLIFSVVLHTIVISFMLINVAPKIVRIASEKQAVKSQPDLTSIVEATTFDQAQVLAEVERVQTQRKAKADAIVAKQKKLQSELTKALKTKTQQRQKLVRLEKQKKQLQREKVKQQAARKKQAAELAKLKKQQAIHDKEVAKVKAQVNAARQAERAAKKEAQAKQAALAKQTAEAEKLVQAKALAEQQAKAAAAAEKQAQAKAAEAERLAATARAQQAKRQAAQAQHQAIVNKYALQIRNVIERNWMYPRGTGQLTCLIALSLSPSGQVLDAKLVRSSGDSSIDRLAIAAVYKSSPLPVPSIPDDFAPFRQINLTVSTHS